MLKDRSRTVDGAALLKREWNAGSNEERVVHPEMVRAGIRMLLPESEYQLLASIFQALADPSRLKILYTLLAQEMCTCDLAVIAGISEPAVSQHLRALRSMHLVKSRREGKFVYYSLDDSHIVQLLELGLEHQGHVESAADKLHRQERS